MKLLREVLFEPYGVDMGPKFYLFIWDTGRMDRLGYKHCLAYRLNQHSYGHGKAGDETLFEGDDFCPSPMYAIDSDDTVRALMDFLTLQPGDTDAEYFEEYTSEQLEYCSAHAESLRCEVDCRFGDVTA